MNYYTGVEVDFNTPLREISCMTNIRFAFTSCNPFLNAYLKQKYAFSKHIHISIPTGTEIYI